MSATNIHPHTPKCATILSMARTPLDEIHVAMKRSGDAHLSISYVDAVYVTSDQPWTAVLELKGEASVVIGTGLADAVTNLAAKLKEIAE